MINKPTYYKNPESPFLIDLICTNYENNLKTGT